MYKKMPNSLTILKFEELHLEVPSEITDIVFAQKCNLGIRFKILCQLTLYFRPLL